MSDIYITHGEKLDKSIIPTGARKTNYQVSGVKYICYAWKEFDKKLGFEWCDVPT